MRGNVGGIAPWTEECKKGDNRKKLRTHGVLKQVILIGKLQLAQPGMSYELSYQHMHSTVVTQ